MKKKVIAGILCATLLVALAACSSNSSNESESTSESSTEAASTETATDDSTPAQETEFQKALAQVDEDLAPLPAKDSGAKLGAIESTLSNSFWVTMQEGYEDTAKEYGVTIDVQATDSDTDTEGQLNLLNTMAAKDYDAIAVSPLTTDCLTTGIAQASKDGLKIITTGNETDEAALKDAGGSLAGKVTIDFAKQGEMGAQYIAQKHNNTGKVAIIAGNEGGTQADARRDGAKQAFEDAGMDVVAVEQCDFDAQKAYEATLSICQANPDLVGITCGNDDMAMGVIKALQESDMNDQVTVVGVDFTEEGKQAIKDGTYDASVAMSPYLIGKEATIIMLKALEGQDVTSVGDSTPMVLVDSTNVADMEDWK